jgi:hypothetical protein
LLEFFEAPIIPEMPITKDSSKIVKIHWGRLKASKFFFRIAEVRSDRKLWDSLKAVSSSYRAYQGQKILVDKMQYELEQANIKIVELGRHLDDQISKIAFSYTMIENPRIRPEQIINGSQDVTQEIRDQIMQNCRM